MTLLAAAGLLLHSLFNLELPFVTAIVADSG
jgi:hypothetical protein